MRYPDHINKGVIQHIGLWLDEATGDFDALSKLGALDAQGKPDTSCFITTTVSNEKVVDAELVKRAVQFDGTTQRMERCIDDLTHRLTAIQQEIDVRGLGFRPKAIYVCKTNITDDGTKDDPSRPFENREAPPIRIWQYLVNDKKIDPKDIAVYANLNFIEGNKPDEFNLFSKKESDFDEFTEGNFQHIIFNLSLQEGWDDPACYLAYIDKSMGSSVQVEQVIGRALRQYGAKHYDNPLLNSAHFFIRVDNKQVFVDAIKAVKSKLEAEGSAIEIMENYGGPSGAPQELFPKEDASYKLCHVNVSADDAMAQIAQIVSIFPTFQPGGPDTKGQAHAGSQKLDIKNLSSENASPSWEASGNTNPVRLRWLASTAIRSRSNRALAVTDLKGSKFDIRVETQSNANHTADKMSKEVVDAYYQRAELVYESSNPFLFGAMRVASNAQSFANGLYEKYSGFNKPEGHFANALDDTGFLWHRNPVAGGFHIPLLSEGDTASFYPDFIVWKGKLAYCIDTKGKHLITEAVARKLFDIKDGDKTKILVRLVLEGKQDQLRGKIVKGGFTVWKMKSAGPTPFHVHTVDEAVLECLK